MSDSRVEHPLDTTLAGKMAKELDAKDGKIDGFINAKIWNVFIDAIETGNKIKHQISIERAMDSITTYCLRKAADETNKTGTEKAREWHNDFDTIFDEEQPQLTNEDVVQINGGSEINEEQEQNNQQQNTTLENNAQSDEAEQSQNNQGNNSEAPQIGNTRAISIPGDSISTEENKTDNISTFRKKLNELSDFWHDRDKVCTDGEDDGHLSCEESTKYFLKGFFVGTVKEVCKNPVGAIKGVAIAGGATAAVGLGIAAVTGLAAGPVIAAVGVVAGLGFGIYSMIKGLKQNKEATNDGDAKRGMEQAGMGAFMTVLSGLGAKKCFSTIKTKMKGSTCSGSGTGGSSGAGGSNGGNSSSSSASGGSRTSGSNGGNSSSSSASGGSRTGGSTGGNSSSSSASGGSRTGGSNGGNSSSSSTSGGSRTGGSTGGNSSSSSASGGSRTGGSTGGNSSSSSTSGGSRTGGSTGSSSAGSGSGTSGGSRTGGSTSSSSSTYTSRSGRTWRRGAFTDTQVENFEYFEKTIYNEIAKSHLKFYDLRTLSPKDFKKFADMLGITETELRTGLSNPGPRKALYRKLSLKFHPDRNKDNNFAEEIFKMIQNTNINPTNGKF